MKWDKTPAFDADLGRLARDELKLFRAVVQEQFSPAADRISADPAASTPVS